MSELTEIDSDSQLPPPPPLPTVDNTSELTEIDSPLPPPPPDSPQFILSNGPVESQHDTDSPVSQNMELERDREEEEASDRHSPSFSYSDGDLMDMSDDEMLGQSVTETGTGSPGNETSSEMGQMVCGQCQELLSYPCGFSHIQCSCCQTVNLVLESCQVGTVFCAQCSEHLMYPFGSPSVRCASCLYVTEIGPHNLAPPLSVQLGENFPTSDTSEFESTNGGQ